MTTWKDVRDALKVHEDGGGRPMEYRASTSIYPAYTETRIVMTVRKEVPSPCPEPGCPCGGWVDHSGVPSEETARIGQEVAARLEARNAPE